MDSTPRADTMGLAKLHTTSRWGLLHHILGASACCHLTKGHWEQERGMGLSATGVATLIGVETPTGIHGHQHCDLRPKVRDFLMESCQMTLVDVTHINQLHHGPKSIIPSHFTIRRLWSPRRIIFHQLLLSHHPRNWVGKWRRGNV